MNLEKERIQAIKESLREDIGSGDITAHLIPPSKQVSATLIVNEQAIICGKEWVNQVFSEVTSNVVIDWRVADGDLVEVGDVVCVFSGSAREILTAERCALNWLQTLSGVSTHVWQVVQLITGTKTAILDTRKTIPGLRLAQKYAVKVGGGQNHRMGLYDAFLIKENHIISSGSIQAAVLKAREYQPTKPIEVEVESLDELEQALEAGADIVMCDNFSIELLREAVKQNKGRAKLEASGNINRYTIRSVAETGVDYVSMGALTKNVTAIDFSLRFMNGDF